MNISTSINVLFGYKEVTDQLTRIQAAGFTHMDIDFCDWAEIVPGRPVLPFADDRWESWVEEIKAYGDAHGVSFNQAHGPLFNIFEVGERGDHLRAMCSRSIEAAARLGIPWVVYHAGTGKGAFDAAHIASLKEENHRFFDPLVELAEKRGVGIALENMSNKFGRGNGGMYCAITEDLIDLVDSFHSKNVGICWDTGHANLQGVNQAEELAKIGSRLKCLHIQDSDGQTDQHTAPFYGNIDWNALMAGLKAIGYAGDLTFESHMLIRKVPDSCRDAALRLLYQIGCELKSRFETA